MINSSDINKVTQSIAVFLVEQLMEMKKISRDEAVELLISTSTYDALMTSETELYLVSKEAVLDMLLSELAGNDMKYLL